jgi:SAM-dependent methyltransferase
MFEDAAAYDGFMGRYSSQLAPQMAALAGVAPGQHVLDVGAGTGMLTSELVRIVGAGNVAAVDPSASFVDAVRLRFPGVNASVATAEELPFGAAEFEATLAQLVVHFMSDPVAGIREMRRVTRPGGVVAACVWDDPASNASPLSLFWRAVRVVETGTLAEDSRPGSHDGDLVRLFSAAGLVGIEQSEMWIHLRHETFEDWWTPYEDGTGPAGRYLATRTQEQKVALREAARSLVPVTPFQMTGRAWAARGVVPD